MTYGEQEVTVDISFSKVFEWMFVLVDVHEPTLGADFNHHHRLGLQLSTTQVNNFYIQVGHENGKEAVTGGFFGNLFRTLIELTNSTYTLSVLPGYSYGHRRPNSTEWSGLIGVLQRREADISACEVTIGLDRIDALSFAQPVRNAGCRFYFQKQFQEMMFKPYLQPFDGRVWIALLVYVIATGILKWFFQYLLRERADPITATFAIVAALLNQECFKKSALNSPQISDSTDQQRIARCAIRVLYFWICALFLILRIGYGARLTATSTLRQSTLPYHGMEDILASDWSVNVISNSFALESMQMSPSNSTARKLWQTKIDNNPDSMVQTVEDGLKNVLDQKNLAFLGFEDSCREVLHSRFSPDQSCKISELDGVFFKAPLSFALPRDSEFLVTINYWILKLFESGIIDRLSRKWLPKPSVCDDNKGDADDDDPVFSHSRTVGALVTMTRSADEPSAGHLRR
ncbi:glutamate receptor 1-like [Schistocerca serialis cubense]|uniref:glutamate receptor 1-like n=1 Tax=Schistocerca serialis cubense TaxID=2023355 RepID=UPI00214EA22E|nr:glutamate receptor 1-like [Schistocerca serialis cubense]